MFGKEIKEMAHLERAIPGWEQSAAVSIPCDSHQCPPLLSHPKGHEDPVLVLLRGNTHDKTFCLIISSQLLLGLIGEQL